MARLLPPGPLRDQDQTGVKCTLELKTELREIAVSGIKLQPLLP